jgi:hypothetical protein
MEEQLQGTCRILETIVAPCVNDPLGRTTLEGVVANLRMLAGALPAVPGFLRRDSQATLQLLLALRGSLAEDVAARLTQALEEPEPDPVDGAALDERNRRLRELLARAVCSEGLSPEQHRAIVQYMTQRASQVPMRYVATAPSPPPTAKT